LRVYETWCRWKLRLCGKTGACAACVAGQLKQAGCHLAVTATFARWDLHIEWQGEDQPIFMTGPAEGESVLKRQINL